MTARARARLVAALLVALFVALPVLGGPSSAQALKGTVALVEQTTWHSADDPFDIRLRIETGAPPDQVEVAATVYRRVTSRSEFAQTVQGRFRGSVLALTRTPLTDLVVDADGTTLLSLTPPVSREGVYPIRIELRDKGGAQLLDAFTTHLINLAPTIEGDRLRVGVVVPIAAPPSVQPNGSTRLDPDVATAIGVIARSLDAHPDLGVTLAPVPETVDALASSARDADKDALDALARVGRAHHVVGQHYVRTNLPSLLASGLTDEADRQLAAGQAALERAFGAASSPEGPARALPDETVRIVDERLDDAAVAYLQERTVARILVPESVLEPVALPTTLTQPFQLTVRQRSIPAAFADSALGAYFTSDVQPVLAAHQLLADLADIYFDHPGRPGEVVVMPPREWRPDAAFLETFLAGLSASPIAVGATLTDIFEVPPATAGKTALVRRLAAGPASLPTLAENVIRGDRARIDGFASLAGADNPVVTRMNRTLLSGEADDLRSRTRQAYFDGVRQQIDGELHKVQIPSARSITLTAREGEIPITIHNSAAYPMRVVLVVDSETLEFPLGSRSTIDLVRENTTQAIRVRARASGSFPLRIRLESPDRSLLVAQTQFTVRSTATSGVGIALSAGAAIFLVVWWGKHLRGRRSRRLVGAE